MGQNLTAEKRKALVARIEKELEQSNDYILQGGDRKLQSAAAMSDDPIAPEQQHADRGKNLTSNTTATLEKRPPPEAEKIPSLAVVDDSNEHYTIYSIRIDAAGHKPETFGLWLQSHQVPDELLSLFPQSKTCTAPYHVDSYAEKAGFVTGDIMCWFDPDGREPCPPRPGNLPATMLFTLEEFEKYLYYNRRADEHGLISIFIARKKPATLLQQPMKRNSTPRSNDPGQKRSRTDTFDDLSNSSRATLPPKPTTGGVEPTKLPRGNTAPESGATNNNDGLAAVSLVEHGVNQPHGNDNVVTLLTQAATVANDKIHKLQSSCQTLLDKVRRLQSDCQKIEARINESCACVLSRQKETTANVYDGPVYKDLPAEVAAAVPMPRLELGGRHWQAFGMYMQRVTVQMDACEKLEMNLTTCAKAWEVALGKAVASEQEWQKDLKKMQDYTLKCFHEAKERMLKP